MSLDSVANHGDIDDGSRFSFRCRTDGKHIRQSAFGHHQMRALVSNQDTQSPAKKIIGNLVPLTVAGQIKGTMGADRFINRVCKACLVKSIEIC